ncbi:MAG: hypothetical protein JNM65_07200 [Verrucomicrobiaceae bacterium]|nr:hypothetical protein [Verrucomicrobiaceae bacterium]
MTPERDHNPYAAPQSDVTPRSVHAGLSKRPASSKWALWVFVMISAGWLSKIYDVVQNRNWSLIHENWPYHLKGAFCLNAFMALLLFKANKYSFLLGSIGLAWLAVSWSKWALARAQLIWPSDPIQVLILLLLALSLLLLFHRFAFGKPSRRYFQQAGHK